MPPDAEYAATRAGEWTRCRSVHSIAGMNKGLGTAGHQNGMRIRILRVERDLTLTEFAERLGVGAPYLSKIERRHIGANVGILIKIAREFNVAVDDLILRDTEDARAA